MKLSPLCQAIPSGRQHENKKGKTKLGATSPVGTLLVGYRNLISIPVSQFDFCINKIKCYNITGPQWIVQDRHRNNRTDVCINILGAQIIVSSNSGRPSLTSGTWKFHFFYFQKSYCVTYKYYNMFYPYKH